MSQRNDDYANHPLKNVKFDQLIYLSEAAVSKCRCVKCKKVPFSDQAFLQTSCGHLICEQCKKGTNASNKCELCSQESPLSEITTHDIVKALNKVEVFCPNFDNGCHVITPVSNFLKHQNDCTRKTKIAQPQPTEKSKVEDAICKGKLEEAKEFLRDLEKAKRTEPAIPILSDKIKYVEKEGKLAMSYMSKLRYPMALEHATKLLQDSYDDVKFLCLKAECLILMGQIQEAEILYGKLLQKEKQNTDVNFIDALIKFHHADYEAPIKICEEILKKEKHEKVEIFKNQVDAVKTAIETAKTENRNRQYQDAQLALKEVFAYVKSTNKLVMADLLELRAEASLKLSAYIDAVADCRRAIEYDPKRIKTLIMAIDGNIGMEEYHRALEDGELAYTMKREDTAVRKAFHLAVVSWEAHKKQPYNGKYSEIVTQIRKEFPGQKAKPEKPKQAPPNDAKPEGDGAGNDESTEKPKPKVPKKITEEEYKANLKRILEAKTAWEVVGLTEKASHDEILAILSKYRKIYHPDGTKTEKVRAGEAFKIIKKFHDEYRVKK